VEIFEEPVILYESAHDAKRTSASSKNQSFFI
jgi:hypothetical protein